MEREIVGFRQDDEGAWVAELGCRHRQHVRHRPPWTLRPWVLTAEGRASQLGHTLDCPLCDRAELPADLEVVRRAGPFTGETMPAGLRRAHRVAAGSWGELEVLEGRLRFRLAGTAPEATGRELELGVGDRQAIPPGVDHEVEPVGPVRFTLAFLR